ncbi:uncharacterized protein [Nicotiana sylvestris]|uniref:uncharacterized protein n=1 Tax=Nicotiana sylvestris TaxID=4096 RepID=UPI00388C904C
METMPHSTQPISSTPGSNDKDLLIRNLAEELKKLTSRIQGVEGSKGIEGLNYEDLYIQPNVELPEGYKPPKFEMFDGTGDPRVHLRTYYDKMVGVGKDERICMKPFMRSLKGDTLSWYISQDPKKWSSWVSMVSDFMDMFRFNIENAPDVFYIQNLKKKPTETFSEYATRWRSKAAKLYERLKVAGYITAIPAATPDNPSQWIIMAKEPAPNVRNNPLPDHKGEDVHMIEIEDDWDPEGSIELIVEGDDPKKPIVTLNPIIVQIYPFGDAEVNMSMPLEFETTSYAKTPSTIEVEFVSPTNAPTPFEVAVLPHVRGEDTNTLLRVLSEAYVPSNITGEEMANMVGQVLESHKITFHEDELPPEGLGHNKALHITMQCEDYFITRILIDGVSNLNICPLVTLKKLGKGLHEIKDRAINVKAFNGSQRSTIGEISLCLQMGTTWFDVDFQVIDVPASYNLLLGHP